MFGNRVQVYELKTRRTERLATGVGLTVHTHIHTQDKVYVYVIHNITHGVLVCVYIKYIIDESEASQQ